MPKKASKTKPANPAYPDAHPTAPGGMSKADLRVELAEKHHVPMDESRDMKWPALIDAVVQGRLDREREAGATASTEAAHEEQDTNVNDTDQSYSDESADMWDLLGEDEDEDEDDFDPEALMADIAAAQVIAEAAETDVAEPPALFIGMPTTMDYVFDGHAGAGPSASERWLHCTASLQASREFLETLTPNQQAEFAHSGDAARQGTTAHAVGEAEANLALGRLTQQELDATLLMLSQKDEAEAYDEEMAEYVTEYTDLIRQFAHDRGADNVLIEARVEAAVPLTGDYDGEVYGVRGSGDCIVLPTVEEPELVVVDLKYGDGIDVSVDENPQVRIYGLGALALLVDDEGNLTGLTLDDRVVYYIVQPRLGGIKVWSETVGDLLEWRDEVLAPALTKALAGVPGGATFNPSEVA